jgi:hypothetical protein
MHPTPSRTTGSPSEAGSRQGRPFETAVVREIFEETGHVIGDPGPCIWRRRKCVTDAAGVTRASDERYFWCPVPTAELSRANLTHSERSYIQEFRWWTIDDPGLRRIRIFPAGFGDAARSVLRHGRPGRCAGWASAWHGARRDRAPWLTAALPARRTGPPVRRVLVGPGAHLLWRPAVPTVGDELAVSLAVLDAHLPVGRLGGSLAQLLDPSPFLVGWLPLHGFAVPAGDDLSVAGRRESRGACACRPGEGDGKAGSRDGGPGDRAYPHGISFGRVLNRFFQPYLRSHFHEPMQGQL